ncbi:Zn(II)2Cys6 transcription factor [Colletotrichum tofieldiae]|uniref:Zn(II)2Cys6 transcription factor n=1 Tax=Colletotrichum tofieldiae TaxID=708197 RepID=A0A166R7A5_9PEZI|nr:Zn(II)2Cys6 transcription factor [Colletotrichum tofieldiae]
MVVDDEQSERYFTRGRLSRGRGLRNTTGCATCRRRHVKCDEKKPVCGGCERTKHACVYTPRRPPNRKRSGPISVSSQNEGASRPSTQKEAELPQAQSPRQMSSECSPVINDSGQVSLPSLTIGEPEHHLSTTAATTNVIPLGNEEIQASHDDSMNDGPDFEQQAPDQSATDPLYTVVTPHDAAQTSSSFGVNLDNATAIWVDLLLQDASMQEFDLSSLNFEAEGIGLFGSTVVQSPAVGRSSQKNAGDGPSPTPGTSHPYLHERVQNLDEYQTLEKQAWKAPAPLSLLSHEHILFQNFVQHMDLFEPKSPFGTLVPQLAMRNVGLMNAILALSARHLSLGTNADRKDSRDPNDALRHYYKTLHYIQEAMQHDTYKASLELLATSSIVSAYEMLDGSRQDWERHLKGVFCIQRSQGIHGDSLGLKQAVWWAWLCQDIWAAFREKRRPFTFWRPLRTMDELDSYELAARSVYFFAQVVSYCSHEEMEAGKSDPIARIAAAERLKDMLENWRRHLTAEFQPLPFESSSEDVFEPIWINPPAFAVAFQVYYCSQILLLMHSPVLGGLEQYTQQRKRLMECVKRVCGIGMTLTDYPSSIMSSQCLFIAGLPLENSRERNCVLEMLDACRDRSGWPIKPLGEELKARWESPGV